MSRYQFALSDFVEDVFQWFMLKKRKTSNGGVTFIRGVSNIMGQITVAVVLYFSRRQMISIESATTPHSFNELLLLILPHPQTPRIDKFNAFIISIVKIMNVPLDFFLVWKGPQLAPMRPLGPRLHYVGPK